LKVYRRELKNLVDTDTFHPEPATEQDFCTPIMDLNKVKLRSDGTLDKLKSQLIIREDLQQNVKEDKWSPTTSFRALKIFLAHASYLRVRIHQLDFVGAFLQAKVHSRIFMKLPALYRSIFPEYQKYCGTPLRLIKSMTGMTFSGKYWYQELMEYLVHIGN
jgi:hypothetical protein